MTSMLFVKRLNLEKENKGAEDLELAELSAVGR